jgi:60 kDa SS-A/Ro ribonucleoprotein
VKVWEALLDDMPMEAMLRNLATMTRIGLIKPLGAETKIITSKLRDADAICRSRLHPLKILAALVTYQSGKSVRGENTWTPVQAIVDALNDAFYLAFGNVDPTGKNILLALDVSGSMGSGSIGAMPGMTPRVASTAMALVTANVEPNYHIMGFSHTLIPVPVSPRQRLDDALRITSNIPFGGTDCALPMIYALQNNLKVDAFVIYTDSETYANPRMHPVQALREYRRKTGIQAKLIVVGMLSNGFTIADPDDKGCLDVVGFDTATPSVLSGFIAGEI